MENLTWHKTNVVYTSITCIMKLTKKIADILYDFKMKQTKSEKNILEFEKDRKIDLFINSFMVS